MRIWLVAVGRRMPAWVVDGYQQYARRMPSHLALELKEIEPVPRKGNTNDSSIRRQEAERIRAALPAGAHWVALDVKGKQWSTEKLSERLQAWQFLGSDVALIVGGADGIDSELLNNCAERWSLGPLTLPHPLVRVVLAEQLYRAFTILSGHPYHRA
ncbi:MAG: ribosomal RNA large subunit methyltransferase H [Lysobacteraceae bacterium]|nr:MAG: ribosomal RNA large subunit methyltransferase H [Xanthomonadaceae bacterium]